MSGRKRRRLSATRASDSSALTSEEPIGIFTEPSPSSQMSTGGSTSPDCISLKSDRSIHIPPNIGAESPERSQMSTGGSTSPDCISLKSDRSIHIPPNIGDVKAQSSQMSTGGSTSPDCISLKSDRSIHIPPNIGAESPERSQMSTGGSTSPDCDRSIHIPPNIGAESPESPPTSSCSVCVEVLRDPVRLVCGHWSCKQCLSSDGDAADSPADWPCTKCGKKPRKVSQRQRDDSGDSPLFKAVKMSKEEMIRKFTFISDGDGDHQSRLDTIFTELYITTRESGGPHEEHEITQLEYKVKMQTSSKHTVNHSDIFRPLPGQEKPQTVLTKGNAGIGKSFCVQKFVLDWAQGRANQDVDFVFYIAFRELNLSTGDKSLHELLTEFHPALLSLKNSELYVKAKVIVILDGLDESRLKLDFEVKRVTSVREQTSLGILIANLIRGILLPDAKLWITSRPAAAGQIPAKYIDMVTEIRGFTDTQQKEYFRRRFRNDRGLADRITSHIQSSPQLDIMCQIPIFCWISAILFQEVFDGDKNADIPQTLTEMMAHYLFSQTQRRSSKYDKKTEKNQGNILERQRDFLLKLGKLAFVHLQKNSLIFYEEDLEDCGIDIEEASIYSGFCATVLREEDVFSQRKVYFFVHLTIQEFFAAIYVYDCFANQKNTVELDNFLNLKGKKHTLLELLKITVGVALEKTNGNLSYFLRFLLGLVVESNRRVLRGLLTSLEPEQDTDKKILTYLKSIRRKALSPYSSIILFRVMVEMRDQKIKEEIQEYMTLTDGSQTQLTPLHCSALAHMLQVSKKDLDVLDLKSYNTSEEGRRRLIPAVRSSIKAILQGCKVTREWVEHIAFGLMFPWSPLRDLDLSNNDLHDSGVELLCKGLSSQCCRLKKLRLSGCQVTKDGCTFLASALKTNPSHLRELDLSYNHPTDSGTNLLTELKTNSQFKLSILNVDNCGSHRMKLGFKKYACELTLDPSTAHKSLQFSEGNRKVTWVEEKKSVPPQAERLDQGSQVLCEQGLVGCCYWEVDMVEPFNIGVTYKPTVSDCRLGCNDKSWSLSCSNEGCFVLHGNQRVDVSSLCNRSRRVGVYLDWPAGILSFHRVSSDSVVHLRTVRTTFSGPLYPAVELYRNSSAEIFS